MGVTEGSSKETKKRGRPKKNADPPKKHSVSREKNADPPIIHSVSPSLIAESPPPGFPSKFLVWPVKNRTSLATGSVSAGVSQSKAVHGAVSETLGNMIYLLAFFLKISFLTVKVLLNLQQDLFQLVVHRVRQHLVPSQKI